MASANVDEAPENVWSSNNMEVDQEEEIDVVRGGEEDHIPQNVLLQRQKNLETESTSSDTEKKSFNSYAKFEVSVVRKPLENFQNGLQISENVKHKVTVPEFINNERHECNQIPKTTFQHHPNVSHQRPITYLSPTKRMLIPSYTHLGNRNNVGSVVVTDFEIAQKVPRIYESEIKPTVIVDRQTNLSNLEVRLNNNLTTGTADLVQNQHTNVKDNSYIIHSVNNKATTSSNIRGHREDQDDPVFDDQVAMSCCNAVINVGDGITVELIQTDLWNQFYNFGTEMIITKNGRRMFPVVKVRIRGLIPHEQYIVYLDIEPVDTKRYRYVYTSSQWMIAGTGEPLGEHPSYIHPESPAKGEYWMSCSVISFDKLKLTNNRSKHTTGQICLHSMQKYCPEVLIQRLSVDQPEGHFIIDKTKSYKASFPKTRFITVTAYQNQQITKLKIDSNPFAKGFRDSSKKDIDLEKAQADANNLNQYERSTIPPIIVPYTHHLRPPNIYKPPLMPVMSSPPIPLPPPPYSLSPIIHPNLQLFGRSWPQTRHRLPIWNPVYLPDNLSSSSSGSTSSSSREFPCQDPPEEDRHYPLDLSKSKPSS